MKRAAGFLLVLLLATLGVITTSSGTVPGDTDSSHLVHLSEPYGPQLGVSCDVCHGTETPPVLSGPSNLTNTTVCDTCHSPDGAYDGVDDPNIGARNNWDNSAPPGSLVFNGSGDFQTGKEKWCAGCHDGVPSVINSVSAPNIAGESNSDCTANGVPYACCEGLDTGTCVDYGYYHTGHGKYVSESITCLACHDPDLDHVDSDARTYSVSGNYQAGYRLKLVGGLAPLVIPRPSVVNADQFRQCFSCHNSAPFMDEFNTDTNFRADVGDGPLCLDLDPPENRHWDHLSIDTLEYDSDWGGGPADSPPSCPACHNVHGPRLRVGGIINNAPGMIRTGELIGRYIEGALDLDYFINPCPDTTLSLTNETVGSTGGMMFEYSPTGAGSIVRNGVCDMCHNEAQPYWRAAKKLPANDFSLDGNTKALWSVDNGALTADSIGTNTLTDNNTVGTSTGDMQGGDASADFERNNSEYLSITDASLDSGFPLKSDDDGTFSITLWYKPETLSGSKTLISKYDISQSTKSFFIYTTGTTLAAYIGHTNGTSFELLDNSLTLSTGVWYHIGLTFNNSDKTWKLRVYDDSEAGNPLGEGTGVVLNASGTATNNLSVTTAAFQIGALLNNGSPTYYLDGLIDEVVVFGDILTTGEIDEIRQGTYAVVHTPTTTTTLPLTTTTTLPPTTTTTLPPTTTTTLPPGPTTTTTTLPPGPGNDFSLDGNTKALWRVDNGALTTDFKGTNTLTDNNSVGTSTGDMQEGDASADFERNNSEYLSITNASLDSGFPLKSDDDGTFSITFWYKPETLSGSKTLISKYDISQSTKSFFIYTTGTTLAAYIGHTNGTSFELLDNSLTLSTGVWYHIGLTFNNSDKTWKLRVYDDSEAGNPLGEGTGVVLNASGTATNNLSVTTAAFQIGAMLNNGSPTYYLDGLIDEVVVFDDILTTGEIDQIRQGTYAHVSSSTTTTLPPATTTTTLPGGTTTTTLPPAQNDFSLDGNAVARWSVDNGALTTDFKGTNTLTDNNTVGTSTGDMQEGDASADFEKNNSEYLSITDAILDSGFPLKSDDDGTFSITLWYKPETLSGSQTLISKYDISQSTKSFFIYTTGTTLAAYIGHTNGTSFELLDNSLTLSTGVWYHIGLAFNNSDKTWKLRVYDDSEAGNPLGEGIGVVLNASGTATNNLSVTTAAFQIGAMLKNGSPTYYLDGLIDEVVVFVDILTTGEIDEIRQGTYAVVYTPTTTTTLIPPTTTTTLPPGPGNDFSFDGNTKALWRVDNGALTTDFKGTNTLTDNNTVGTSMGDMQEGDASADFEKNNYESLTLADASLDSGFPLKSDDDGTFSITLWYKPETLSGSQTLISKYDISQSTKSFFIYTTGTTLAAYIGHTNGTSFELLDNSLTLSTGVWYHIGLTFNNSDKTWKLRVYDDSEAGNPLGEGTGVVLNASGTATNNLSVTTAAFQIGALLNNGSPTYYLDGLIDEVVVFDDILTTGEIDEIRQGYYAHVSSSTTTTLPPATTTTTTLPGGTTTTTTLPGGTTTTTTLPGGTTTTTTLPGGTTTTTTLPGGTTTTTLPPAQNDFSSEDNLEALWSVDNGPLTIDSSGKGNTLTDNNTVGTDTVNYKEGDASAHFEKNNYEYLSITDASLVSGFPLKSDDDGTFSITLWYKPETLSGSKTLVSKYDLNESTKSFFIYSAGTTLAAYIGHTNGTSFELLDNSLTLSTGVWYHIGLTFNNTTKAWQFRVYNDSEAGNPLGEGTGVVLNASGTATNYLSVTTAAFQIGALLNSGSPAYYQDGLIDEVVVFDDILTTGEIDRIRQGTYEDLCPGDPNKSEPGVCGCGYTEWGVEPYDCIENDSSHSAHITEASGPQITCGTSCHAGSGMTTGGDFLDANNLTNTTVCDTCHSPLGAYNGVDSTSGSVGAKDNWVSGVYDTVSGGLLLAKEKWCVGCHDGDPSTINGVSAPNMAGDDIDYGYYKTGHGKHNNEAITCLACHDPALMHVDGVARTYSAAADNYQAGYRLKMVDGGLPLDVPRTSPGLLVEQFRLCFSCHDSAPYMNSANMDTNFRADVDDNGVVLVPQANRHAYHLFTTQVWDSDWDGVPSDSAPSCPACHNVHGPRLRDAGVNNAPAMIRTGELIGRQSEGALNLDYFINPARDMTLSSTNELSGSTGGVFMSHGTGGGSVTKNGVCDMCHNEVEPYWREANISIFSCDKCHIHDPHNVEIDLINDLSYNPGQPCSDCHDGNDADLNGTPLDSWTDIESEHDVSTNGDGSCLTCHKSPRQEVIDAIALGANPTNCLNCHSDKNLTPHMYDHATNPVGGLAYAPITADAACTTCHSGDVVVAVHNDTCTTCHTASIPDLKNNNPKLDFNAGISTSYCTTCHVDSNNNGFTVNFHGTSWSHSETTTRHNNLAGSDSSGGYDCASCHIDMADAQAKLTKHMDHNGAGAGNNIAANCYRCHFPSTWGGLNDEPAQSIISAGKGAGPAQNCEACHTAKGVYLRHGLIDDGGADDVSAAHDNFMDENGFATSTCSNCHLAVTEQNRINLHTTTGSGSGNCLTCHQNTTDMGGGTTPQDIIDAGKGPGGGSQHCGTCHISINTDWANHTVAHTTFVLADTNCTSCHDGNPGTNTTAPNSVTTPYVSTGENHNPTACYTCHDNSAVATRGNYLTLGAANVKGYVGAMPAGSTNPTCSNCHTAYFDGHATHTATSGHSVSYDGGVADQVAGGTGCGDCHSPISTWTEINTLHNYAPLGDCGTCHSYDGTNGEFNNTPEATVASVILASGATTCADCHTDKAGQAHGYYDHTTDPAGGLDYAPITPDAACTTCHSGEVVQIVHNDTCSTCHTTAPDLKTTPNLAQFAGTTTSCTDCHSDTNNTGFTVNFHGTSWSHSETTTRHDNLAGSDSSGGYDCASCHTDMADAQAKLTKHMDHDGAGAGNNIAANCNRCHFPNTWGGLNDEPAQTVIASGKGAGTAQNCEDCHTAKGVYLRHGLTDDGGVDDAGDVHNNVINESGTTTSDCSGCHTAVTPLNRVNLHTTNGTGAGNCLTCHQSTLDMDPGAPVVTPQDIIDAGKGAGTAQNCDNCHIAIGGDWTAHNVDHAAARVTADTNCTSCHDGNPGTNTTAPNSVTSPYVGATENHNPSGCYTCHVSGTQLTEGDIKTPGAYTTAIVQGNCSACHTAYFDGHATHTGSSGHDVAYDNGVADQVDDGTGCASCHTPISNWAQVVTLHDFRVGNCATCHDYDGTNGEHNNTPSATVASVIATGTGNTCASCHTEKISPNVHGYYDHTTDPAGGLAYAPITPDGACTTCHSGEVVKIVHGDTCTTCHTASIPGLKTTPNLAQFAGTTTACTDCHSDTNNTGFTVNFHGTSWSHSETTTRHDNLAGSDSSGGYDCASCHTDMADAQAKLTKHMDHDGAGAGNNIAANCYRCHFPSTWGAVADEPAQSIISAGKGAGPAQNCEACHTAKGVYLRHGLTDDGGVDDAGDVHDNVINESGTATSDCSGCHTAVTPLNRVNLHTTNGTGAGNCLTCHQNLTDMGGGTTPQSVIDAGKGAGTAQNCDNCHIAIGGDWTTHNVDHAAARVTADTNCTSCHDGNPGTNTTAPNSVTSPYVGATENHNPSGCYTCHVSGTQLTEGDIKTPGPYTTAIVQGNCSNCHTAYFDGHATHSATTHDILRRAGDTDGTSTCETCHGVGGTSNATKFTNAWDDGSINDIFALHTTTCAFCHGSTRDNTSDPGTVNPTYGSVQAVIQNGTTVGCLDCHFDRSVGHGNIDHTTYDGGAGAGVVKGEDDGLAGTNCVTCHDSGGLGTNDHFINTIHNASGRGCGTCHNSSGGAGSLVSYASPYSAASGSNSLPSLLGGAQSEIDYETNYENGGFCSTCHNPYQTAGNHNKALDHDGQLANAGECDDCHTESTGTTIQEIHTNGCGTCHDTTGGYVMKTGTSAENHVYGATSACTTCHTAASSEFDGTTTVHSTGGTETHASMLQGVSNCTATCHSGNIQTVVHAPNGGCQNCHATASDGSFVNLTYGDATGHTKGIASSCTDCHSKADPYDYNVDFQAHTADTHATNMITTGAAKCTDCHGTGDVKVSIHADDCQNCHINIIADGSFQDGTETDSALGATVAGNAKLHTTGSPSTCLVCHAGYDSNFTNHDATTRDTRHSTYLAGSSKCTGCHSGANIVADVHYATSATDTDCENCHIDTQLPTTDGRFGDGTGSNSVGGAAVYGTATGHTIGGPASTCINCHASYDTDFDGSHSTGGSHTNLTTSGAPQCTDCHGTGDVISNIHAGGLGCENCHTDMTPAGGEDGTLKGSALNYTGGSTTCVDCHTVIAADFDHASHLTNDTHDAMLANYNSATRSEDCDNCHTAANGTAVRDTVHNGTYASGYGNTCLNCHTNLTTDGSLKVGANGKGDATNHAYGVQSTCVTCHTLGYFKNHNYGNTHSGISYNGTVDQSANPLQGCAACHDDAGTSLVDWAAIKLEHGAGTTSCVKCHDKGASGNADQTATLNAIDDLLTGSETCATCHIDKLDGQPNQEHNVSGHTDASFTANALCTDCHNGGVDIVNTIHGGCATCHIDATGGVTLQGSAVGKTLPANGDCTACHNMASADQAGTVALHHESDVAVLGHCESCHSINEVDTGTAPRQPNCVKCHVNDTGTALQIVSYDLTLADASQPVDIQTGAVTSPVNHTITYGAGPATEIYDFRACFECHSGNNANYPTAPVVVPFHGYPGNWTVGHLLAGTGQLPGLGQTAPAAYSDGLDDLNSADELPYFYQWWHPGAGIARGNGIRRFNSVMPYRMGANSRRIYQNVTTGSSTGTVPTGMNQNEIGKDQNFTFQLGNGESVNGGLQTEANLGVTYQTQGYSQSFTIPYSGTGVNSWSDGSGPYTEVPSYPDITGGDVLKVTKADWNGTDLTVYVTNSLGNGSTISLTYTGDATCNGNMIWSPTNLRHELTCTTASFTAGTDQVTVSSNAAASLDVTVYVNDNQGAPPTTDVLTITQADWLNDGDGATTGVLTVWATSSIGDGACAYDLDYSDGTTQSMSWNGLQSRYEGTIAASWNGTADNVVISSAQQDCDANTTATATDQSDTVTDILGPGSSNTRAFYDPASGGTLTVWATHLYNDGSLTYEATYNSIDYLMSWNGASSRYELNNQTGVGAYSTNVTVHSANAGGDSLTANDVEEAAGDDVVTINSQNWRTNGDGSTTGQIVVCFSHSNNDGVCDYNLDYSDGLTLTNVGWNTQVNCSANEYEGVMSNVTWNGNPDNVVVSSGTAGCDSVTTATANDTSDIIDVTQADHDGSNLIVTANLTNDGTCPRNYIVTYELTDSGNMACATDTPSVGQSQYTITWSGAPAFNGGSATVHANVAYGDSASLPVTPPGASGNLLPEHTAHESSGYVTWGSNPYTVAGEGCFNCHGPDDGSIDTVMDVHHGKCNLCHQSEAPVGPDLKTGTMRALDVNQDGSITDGADPLNDGIGPGTCSYCHKAFMLDKETSPGVWEDLRFKTWNHHLSENAQNGNCVHCHSSVRTTPVGQSWCAVPGGRVPKQPPCAYCHVDSEQAYGVDGDFQLQFFDFVANGFNTPLTKLTSTTHTIPNIDGLTSSPIVIHDFAVCFQCHDNTDMMAGMVDGNSASILGPAGAPSKVYPYHASGMSLDLSGAANQETDPGTFTWFPIDRATGYNNVAEAAADVGQGSSDTDPVFDDINWGPGVSDDMFFSYHYHPGRGGIVGTSNTISSSVPNYGGDVTTQVGSFNILFPFMTYNLSSTPKYYQAGDSEGGPQIKNVYQGESSKKYSADYHSANFGVGGTGSPTATCNSSFTDAYGNNWNFCGVHNVPYTDYLINPNPATDMYWSTVPKFDSATVPFPTINDEVRLLNVDCSVPVVEAWSKQSTDYYANGSEIIPDGGNGLQAAPDPTKFYLQVNGGANENMTWDGAKWSVTPSSCTTGDALTVTSTIGGGSGSASFTVP